MRFKHTVHVLIDNFRVTYKLLVYVLIVAAITFGLSAAIIVPFVGSLSDVSAFEELTGAFNAMLTDILKGNLADLSLYFSDIKEGFEGLMTYLGEHPGELVMTIAGMGVVSLISGFFIGLGNYAAGSLINDKMAMQANAPFVATLIKNLGKAALYSVIYVAVSFVYTVVSVALLFVLLFIAFDGLFLLIQLCLFTLCMVLLVGLKMMLISDWLPAIICGKQSVVQAFRYSFSRRSGNSFAVFSFFASSCVLILAVNVLGALGSFGAALIITVPLSYLYLLCYQFVNYCDSNEIKYFTDKRTIVKPEHEKQTSREEFLRGE